MRATLVTLGWLFRTPNFEVRKLLLLLLTTHTVTVAERQFEQVATRQQFCMLTYVTQPKHEVTVPRLWPRERHRR